MIKFNTLKVDSKNRVFSLALEIDDNISYYDNCYIDSIYIDNQKTFTTSGNEHSDSAFRVYDYAVEGGDIREYSDLNIEGIFNWPNFSTNDLFFVYVKIRGIIDPTAPCEYQIDTTIGIAFDKKILYNNALANIRLFAQNCGDKTQLVDYILYHKYFDLCLKAGRLQNAIILWNRLITNVTSEPLNCGCNGRP